MWGLWFIVAPGSFCPVTSCAQKLHRRLEEVDHESYLIVDLVEQFQLLFSVIAKVSGVTPDNRIIFLLHKAVIILAIRPRAGKRYVVLGAV